MRLTALRPFPIWNITVRSETVFEIEDWIGKELVTRGVCVDKDLYDKKRAEIKAKKEAAKLEKIKTQSEGGPKPPEKKTKKGGKE